MSASNQTKWGRLPAFSHRSRSSTATGAIVIGGNQIALSVVRSLGRRGIPVWVLRDGNPLAAVSRYTSRSLPWPLQDTIEPLGYLLDLSVRYPITGWTLFPVGDEVNAFLAQHQDQLRQRFHTATPPWSILRWFYDKRCTYHLAEELGVPYPRTYYPRSREEVATLDCSFPVILKPALTERFTAHTHVKAWRVEDRASLLARYEEACGVITADEIMIQELIPGGGEAQYSFAGLCVDGRPRVRLVARRMRQYPVDFGRASTYVETVADDEVEELARRLLVALAYTGPVECEFKRDPRDGRYKLLDINARFWAWQSIGRCVGLDFPYLFWKSMRGETIPDVCIPAGVRWVRMSSDLPAAALEIRAGRLSSRAYLRSLRRPLEFSTFALDDPLPALLDGITLAGRLGQRAFKAVRR